MLNSGPFNAQPMGGAGPGGGTPPPVLLPSGRWGVRVVLDDVDVSARVTGTVSVEAEESAARIAELQLLPDGATVDLSAWVGLPVTVDYLQLDAAGAELAAVRIFAGRVDEPIYDPVTRLVTLECTDGLQQLLEAMSVEDLEALIGGHWSEDVFGEIESRWDFAQDLLSTIPRSVDIRPGTGEPLLQPWAAKAVPDASFSAVVDGTLAVTLASKRERVNTVALELDYRFTRLRRRQHQFIWAWPGTFCVWFDNTTQLPNLPMVERAATGGSWELDGAISYNALPPSQPDPCGTGANWVNPEAWDPVLLEADWLLSYYGTQTVTERYTLTVQASDSVAVSGEVIRRQRQSVTTEFEAEDWTERLEEMDEPAQDPLGDSVWDQADRDQLAEAAAALLNAARTDVLAAHRRNLVSFQLPCQPALDLPHTVGLDAAGVTARGKIWRVNHQLDLSAGRAVTVLDVAVSRSGAGGVVPDDLVLPAPPDSDAPGDPPADTTILPTQLGGGDDTPSFDEDMDGFSGNYTVQTPGEETYPHRFAVSTPEIEDTARDPIEAEAVAVYAVAVPNDPLEFSL
ncbi:MAG: hypothetical protein JJU06_05715 [Ectothiorhodospiraceae bacterium]|nr:hypothetical protein [Ectothiorhodospiraceae bacterium]